MTDEADWWAETSLTDTLGGTLLRSVNEFADRVAVVHGEHVLTYSELNEAASNLALGLLARGVGPGDRVSIWLPNRPEWVVAQVACAYLGATLVPINTRFRARELEYVLAQTRPHAIVMTDRFMTQDFEALLVDAVPDLAGASTLPCRGLDALKCLISLRPVSFPAANTWEQIVAEGARESEADLPVHKELVSAKDPMLVIWTSGTTSKPKAVALGSEGLEGILNWMKHIGYSGEDRTVVNLPLFYVAGNYYGLLSPLMFGGRAILGETLTPRETLHNVSSHGGTMLLGGPAGYMSLCEEKKNFPVDVSSVQRGYVGGALITAEQVERIRSELNVSGLVQVYGMTETHGVVTSTSPFEDAEDVSGSVGTLMPGYDAEIIDPDTESVVGTGVAGEMTVGGRTMMGYLREGTIASDPTQWVANRLRTGDLMTRTPSGRFQIVGRLKDTIKVKGENVSVPEVEQVILSHPDVQEVAVIGLPDEARGEIPVAVVQFRDGADVDIDGLRHRAMEELAAFKRPRRYLALKYTSDWPRNVSHKVDKLRLRESIQSGQIAAAMDVPANTQP